jgi:hypothetical protein
VATPFVNAITLISDGQSVDAAVTNVPISQLAQRTEALLEVQDAQSTGAMLIYPDATFQPGVVIGNVVYLNEDGTFHLAQSALANTVAGSTASATAYITGVVLTLTSSTTGSVCLNGYISTDYITQSQWQVVMGGTWAEGNYYLSAANAGEISLTVDPLAVFCGSAFPNGSFLLKAQPPVFGAHVHDYVVLSGNPAGTVNTPSTGNPQLILIANPSLQGWLPISTFVGTAPSGAVFWYNIANPAEGVLQAAFPPVPTDSAVFFQGGAQLSPATTIIATDEGIFWLTNTYGLAPWPVDWNTAPVAAPIYGYWVNVLAATTNATVQSLGFASTSALQGQFLGVGGLPASSGSLLLNVPTILANTSTTDAGVLGVKSITGGGFTTGPVTTTLTPGPGVTLTGPNGNSTSGFYGAVQVSATNTSDLQGNADSVFLNNADYRQIQNISMIALLQGRNQSPIFSFNLSRFAPAVSTLTFELWLYSDTSGSVPSSVTIQYLVVPATPTNTTLPSSWTTLTSISGTTVVAGQAAEFGLAPTVTGVPAGSLVMLQVTRNALTSDGFNGNLYLIRAGYELT